MRSGFEEAWRQRFVERGRRFDDDAGIAGWTETGLETRLSHFQRVWPGDTPGALWLDAGCGAGSYTRHIAAHGVRPLGLDYSLPSVQKARERSEGPMIWAVGDVTRLPVRRDSLDGVMCFGVMQALSGPDQAVRELTAAARPGGQIWIDALNRRCAATVLKRAVARLRRRPLSLRYDTPAELARLLVASGAAEVRVYWIPILPRPLRRMQRWLESASWTRIFVRMPRLASALSHAFVISARKAGD